MMRAGAASVALALALAACGPAPERHAADDGPPAAATRATADSADADAVHLPDGYVGRWALAAADCTVDPAIAKGLMTVEPDRLTFYEARARVTHVGGYDSSHVLASLDWSGEGRSWQTETPLTLADDGAALIRRDQETGRGLRYLRCKG